ncbi:MAG: ASCH domain-containing protein [Pyrinomonadaceae bacterium]
MSEKAAEFWTRFRGEFPGVEGGERYQVWYFGNTPEMALDLAGLVLRGNKTATASLAIVNEIKPDEAPIENGYSVVTDFHGEPICVIQTTEIRHLPFIEVDATFAFDEGEGDGSLVYWRNVHRTYFEREAAELGIEFTDRSVVCCERFRLLFPR